ncbi:MAG: DUF2125 domain-containing protein [Pseudomonadota bacterium]
MSQDYYGGASSPRRAKRLGWRIFGPLIVFVVILAIYSAYWHWAKSQLVAGIDAWIDGERARGMQVEYSAKRFDGFPFRFALTLDDPVYGDPDQQQRWQGEKLQLVMQPWNWQHIIARSPGENRIFERGLEGWARLGPKSASSLSWSDTGLERFSIAIDTVSFDLAGELAGEADAFEFHLRTYPGEPDTLQLETHWQSIRLGDVIPGTEPLGQTVGPTILRAEATKAFSALAITPEPSRWPATVLSLGGEIRVPQVLVEWGPLNAGARGGLATGDQGDLKGSVGVRIEKADALREALAEAGRLNEQTDMAIQALEAASTDGRFLELSVRDDGLYMLGNQVIPLDLGGPLG